MTTRRMGRSIKRTALLAALATTVVACGSGPAAPTQTPATVAPTVVPTAAPTDSPSPTPAPSLGNVPAPGEAWIASQANFGIRLVRPDGTGEHMAFPMVPGGEQLHPDWSPDGDRLSFTVRGETDEIWIGDADGSDPRKVVGCQDPCAWADEAAWSPDGTSLIYQRMVSNDGAGVSTLEILDLATDTAHIVLTAPVGRAFYQPRWSPDGPQVVTEFATMSGPAFDSDVIGVSLAIVDVGVTPPTLHELTRADELTNSPDWSRATGLIVFAQPNSAAGFDGPSDLVTMHPDGTGRTVVTSVGPRDGQTPQPAWSPDGSRIIFVLPDSTMATVAADGTDQAPAVLHDSTAGLHPRYRPIPSRYRPIP